MAYRAVLDKPITQSQASDLNVPTLGEGYIDHRFRATSWHPSVNPAQELWWKDCPVRDDLDLYLASYLVSVPAQRYPLLVLGHPGSGKSVLTRVLAARLPADRFLPIRVELRSVDANADLQTQIEEAVRQATGELVRWPDLVRSAPEAMPVVLLDGFDELLQATGVAQTDFLENVRKFQERESDQGRAVAVLVTSRIAVADRARIPADSVVMCLEPFDDRQVKAWLDVWAEHNEAILASRGLRPLTADAALRHEQLAEQPLMLLMLALYDASANALGSADQDFDQAALYEALLTDFARREVEKERPGPAEHDAIERELNDLSVVAFAMFNRRAQWATDEDVTADLTGLRMASPAGGERRMRKSLTAGQLAVGRFFFIHDTRATRDGVISQTYEFLHATFGEYLIARLVAKLIAHTAAARNRASSVLPTKVDDGLLHALLSFECLAARTPIIEFLTKLVVPDPDVTELLVELFSESFDERSNSEYAAYRPLPITVVQRHANWSANLALLATVAGDGMSASRLFGDSTAPVAEWRNTTLLWRGQLTTEGRNGLIRLLEVTRTRVGIDRDIQLWISIAGRSVSAPPPDLSWTYTIDSDDLAVFASQDSDWILRKANFTATKAEDILMHGIEPIMAALPGTANIVIRFPGRPATTPAHALLAAVAALSSPNSGDAIRDLLAIHRQLLNLSPQILERNRYSAMAIGILIAAIHADLVPKDAYSQVSDLVKIASEIPKENRSTHVIRRFAAALEDLLAEGKPPTPKAPTPPAYAASPIPSPSPEVSSPETPATPPAAP
ncbi:NACHT domain-containing protein [Catenulispora yoronensis]